MERTKKIEAIYKPLRWKNSGGGSFRMPNRIIKPNEVFIAVLSDIPEAFRDVIICLDEAGLKAQEEGNAIYQQEHMPVYTVKRTKGGKYNVVNEDGKSINEEPLSKENAEELKTTLES